MKKQIAIITIFLMLIAVLCGCSVQTSGQNSAEGEFFSASQTEGDLTVREDGAYTSEEEVAEYIHVYETLPQNFITKKEARSLGWQGGSLEPYAPGKSIGGDRFGNREGLLPEEDAYKECDIDTKGRDTRGAKRIVYSDDGDIYYTKDHYESFTQLYEGK